MGRGGSILTPFFITGLPRSRTAWLAAYFTDGKVFCHHELLKKCATREAFYQGMRDPKRRIGNSDSALPITDFQTVFPDSKTVIIERAIGEVNQSLSDLFDVSADMGWAKEKLNKLVGMRVPYDHLDDMLPQISNYIGIPYNRDRHDLFRCLNVETFDFASKGFDMWSVE